MARQLGNVYREALEWSQRLKRAHVEGRFVPLVSEMAKFTDDLVEQLRGAGPEFLRRVEEGLANLPGPGEPPRRIEMTVPISLSNLDRVHEEFNRLISQDY